MAIVVIIRRYRQSKNLNQHTPDSYNLKSSLSPRLSKLRISGQLLCPVDTKQLPIEDAQNHTKIEENWKEESKETDDCCRKLPNNDYPEDNASPFIPVQVNGTHVPDHTEGMEELYYSSPNSSKYPKLNVLSSGQTIGYEQIQGYEKIQHYEQIQGYEKFRHCESDVNLSQLVGEVETETAASTLASSKQTFGSNENIQAQCHQADSCHECKEHNVEVSLTACESPVQDIKNITESNFVIIRAPIALDSASVQIESDSPIPESDDIYENEGLQDPENDTRPCFEGSNSNSGDYEWICHYERIEH